jgi:hypothetical protein
MAKEQFERAKPHLSQAVGRLQRMGISALGAQQALNGQLVSSSQDRAQLARLISAATKNHRLFKYDGIDGESQ